MTDTPFLIFDPTDLRTIAQAVPAFFNVWYDIPYLPAPDLADARIKQASDLVGHKLPDMVERLISIGAAAHQMALPEGFGDFQIEYSEKLEALLLFRFGDDDVGYDHYGVAVDNLHQTDPPMQAFTYDEDDGAWGVAYGRPLASSQVSAFVFKLLLRQAPQESVIGSVPVEKRFGFLQQAFDIFGVPYEAKETHIFEGCDTLVGVEYWPAIGEYAVHFVHQTGRPVSDALKALLAAADIPGGLG